MQAICISNKSADILYFNRFTRDLTEQIFLDFLGILTSSPLGEVFPHMVLENMEFVYVYRDDLFWCLCYKSKSFLARCGPAASVANMDEFYRNCSYFLGNITQHSVAANIEVIHEIVLETMKSGIMQSQKPEKLKQYILSTLKLPKESSYQKLSSGLFGQEQSAITSSKQSVLSMNEDNKEIYIDVVEKISVTVDRNGDIIYSEVNGTASMSSYVSSSPIITLELNSHLKTIHETNPEEGYSDEIPLSNVDFSSEVIRTNLITKKRLEVVAVPGKMHLFGYSLSPTSSSVLPFQLSFKIKQLTESDSCVELKLVNKTGMSSIIPIAKVKFSVPATTTSIMTQSSGITTQKSEFSAEDKLVTWTINDFPGGSFAYADIRFVDSGRNVSIESAILEFEISNWLMSGLCIENVFIPAKEVGVRKWVRYVSLSDSIMYRW